MKQYFYNGKWITPKTLLEATKRGPIVARLSSYGHDLLGGYYLLQRPRKNPFATYDQTKLPELCEARKLYWSDGKWHKTVDCAVGIDWSRPVFGAERLTRASSGWDW
jgi:hypothetical protein